MMHGGMDLMMGWMMGIGLLGWVLVVALLVTIVVVLVRLVAPHDAGGEHRSGPDRSLGGRPGPR